MNRLTKKLNDNSGYEVKEYGSKYNEVKLDAYFDAVDKLGKLEDLEEQLGCPLEVIFKALTIGIWYEDVANRMTHIGVGLDTANYDCEYLLREYNNEIRFLPRNYKRTWWLYKDKSE